MGNLCVKPAQRSSNSQIYGYGGDLVVPDGRKVCIVVGFDYDPQYYASLPWGGMLQQLTSTKDGKNFAELAKASGAEVREFYDKPLPGNLGFPAKDLIVSEMKRLGSELDGNDTFIFFYGGHGKQSQHQYDQVGELSGDQVGDTELCFCDQQGNYNPFLDDEIAEVFLESFSEETTILVVTDCCQSGTVCDLGNPRFGERPICHLAAVKDSQFALDWGEGGGFTTCIVEAVEDLAGEGETEFSIVQLYNRAVVKFQHACEAFGDDAEEQTFSFQRSPDSDPDQFFWPLVPYEGWSIQTMLDTYNIREMR